MATMDKTTATYPLLTKRADIAFRASERCNQTLQTADAALSRVRGQDSAEKTLGTGLGHLDVLATKVGAANRLSKADAKFGALMRAADPDVVFDVDVTLAGRFEKLDNEFERGHLTRKDWTKRRAALVLARAAEADKADNA